MTFLSTVTVVSRLIRLRHDMGVDNVWINIRGEPRMNLRSSFGKMCTVQRHG